MCGLVGIIDLTQNTKDHSIPIVEMNNTLNHRGPDGEGVWVSDCKKVYLGHKRLSIIDLSLKASQPMSSKDGRYVLVFNGEIYNYKELREECIKHGSRFNTHSDTEVIIESYRHWNTSCFSKFKGMWALALVDLMQHKVILSRDPFAIKPLYYGYYHGCLYFGSEPQALTCTEYFTEEDLITSHLFLEYGYLERDSWTFFKNIKRFPHAHYTEIDLDRPPNDLKFSRYWAPSSKINHSLSYGDTVNQLREILTRSVELHLRSDVPVGSCLSGGIDSSAIVSIGSSQLENGSFTTFTTHYPQYKSIDESQWAKQVIQTVNAQSYFVEPTKELFVRELDNLIQAQGEPFGSMSIFAQYSIFKKISETNVKVILDGQGSDEMLAGYLGFLPAYFDDLVKQKHIFTLLKELVAFRDLDIQYGSFSQQIKKAFRQLILRKQKTNNTRTICQTEFKDELEYRLAKLSVQPSCFEARLEELLCESNIPQLLRYEDRNSMYFSIESRVPFLERELVDFILSLPANYRVRRGYTKAVLRDALKGIIPDSVRLRRDKLGFPAPETQWLKECFNIDTETTGSKAWREFIYNRWLVGGGSV